MFGKLVNYLTVISILGLIGVSLLPVTSLTMSIMVACCWLLIICILLLFTRLIRYLNPPLKDDEDDQSLDTIINLLRSRK